MFVYRLLLITSLIVGAFCRQPVPLSLLAYCLAHIILRFLLFKFNSTSHHYQCCTFSVFVFRIAYFTLIPPSPPLTLQLFGHVPTLPLIHLNYTIHDPCIIYLTCRSSSHFAVASYCYIVPTIAALKFCFKTCVAMKFVDDDDDDIARLIYSLRNRISF